MHGVDAVDVAIKEPIAGVAAETASAWDRNCLRLPGIFKRAGDFMRDSPNWQGRASAAERGL